MLRAPLLFYLLGSVWVWSFLFPFSPARAPDTDQPVLGSPVLARSVTIPATWDRTEGSLAVLYWGEDMADKIEIPVKYLPIDGHPGIRLRVVISVDEAATERLRKRIRTLQQQLHR